MRALLLRLLWRAFGPVPAFIVAALVFGALHLANPGATPLAGATVVMAGLMFCTLYALTGRLWVPIGLHLAWNLTQGYLFGATVSGNTLGGSIAVSTAHPGAAAWLTGGSFGPEASVVALLLVSSATVGALALARKRWAGTPRRQRRRSRAAAAVTSLHPEAGDSAPRSLHQQPSLHHPPTQPTHPTHPPTPPNKGKGHDLSPAARHTNCRPEQQPDHGPRHHPDCSDPNQPRRRPGTHSWFR
jgi:hypothetical protein